MSEPRAPLSFAVMTEIPKDCVMVTTSAWWHDGNSCKHFGKVLEKRFEVKQTGHIGFSAIDAKELKILNRTIKHRCAERRDDVGS